MDSIVTPYYILIPNSFISPMQSVKIPMRQLSVVMRLMACMTLWDDKELPIVPEKLHFLVSIQSLRQRILNKHISKATLVARQALVPSGLLACDLWIL